MHAIAGTLGVWLGHERADHAHVIGDLAGSHAEERETVRRFHGVAVGVIDFELAVGVFVIDLIDVETHWLQGFSQALEEFPRARQTFVVVARFVEGIAGVDHLQAADSIALEQAELGLQPGVQGPAALLRRSTCFCNT